MIARSLFFKKKKFKKNLSWLCLILLFFIIIFYIFYKKNDDFIIISENKEKFYIIPEDRGGEKVQNIDKKSLNLQFQKKIKTNLVKPEDLLFSIQFYTNNNLNILRKILNNLTDSNENIYNKNDFYILALETNIGIDYFLLYKNFKSREIAQEYCINFLSKIDNCLIVDTTKF